MIAVLTLIPFLMSAPVSCAFQPRVHSILKHTDAWNVMSVVDAPWDVLSPRMNRALEHLDWRWLQALAFVAYLCQRPALYHRAWSLGYEAYLSAGGIPALAQEPSAFPWWQWWDLLMTQHLLSPEEAWSLYRAGMSWTPNLWDRDLRARVLGVWLREKHAYTFLKHFEKLEREAGDRWRDYRVSPLSWKAWMALLKMNQPFFLAYFFFVLGWGIGFSKVFRTHTPFLVGMSLLIFILVLGSFVQVRWYETAFDTWSRLRANLLKEGFLSRSIPEPWISLFERDLDPDTLPRATRKEVIKWYAKFVTTLQRLKRFYPELEFSSGFPFIQNATPSRLQQAWFQDWSPGRMMSTDVPFFPAPRWTLLHSLHWEANWGSVMKVAFWWFYFRIKKPGVFLILIGIGGFFFGRYASKLNIFLPGALRFRSNHPWQGLMFMCLTWPITFLFISMKSARPDFIWGKLISESWYAFIQTLDKPEIILWGNFYIVVLAVCLFLWTVHVMISFIELKSLSR